MVIELADKINFIGSVSVGKEIAKRCGERLIPCSTELSGKDAAIVLADAPFERAVNGVLWGAFTNAGQNCASIERLYVEDAIYDRFVPALVERVGRLRLGDDVGPLRNDKQMALVVGHVQNARDTGSKILAGGERVAGSLFFQPTVIEVADRNATFLVEETFGPTLPIIRVKDAEEAIAEANRAKFGLTGSVWTSDLARAEVLARRLEVGVATINNCVFTGALTSAPWGGVKETGHGVTNSKYGLLEMTRPAFVLSDKSTGPKESWWYPYGGEVTSLMRAVVSQLGGNVAAVLKLPFLLPRALKRPV
ncbi:MAG: aldehyde dehydrogenase family protein [Deltaproteobacteria bacterium]|nr:aldehyde dehydrogenase family protein [Deltaproteobacteria bacterium]